MWFVRLVVAVFTEKVTVGESAEAAVVSTVTAAGVAVGTRFMSRFPFSVVAEASSKSFQSMRATAKSDPEDPVARQTTVHSMCPVMFVEAAVGSGAKAPDVASVVPATPPQRSLKVIVPGVVMTVE